MECVVNEAFPRGALWEVNQADAAVPGTTDGDPGESYKSALDSFFLEGICSGGGVLSDRDRDFHHQIRSLLR